MKYFGILVIVLLGIALIGCTSQEETTGKAMEHPEENIPPGHVDQVSEADILSEVDNLWVKDSDNVDVGDLY